MIAAGLVIPRRRALTSRRVDGRRRQVCREDNQARFRAVGDPADTRIEAPGAQDGRVDVRAVWRRRRGNVVERPAPSSRPTAAPGRSSSLDVRGLFTVRACGISASLIEKRKIATGYRLLPHASARARRGRKSRPGMKSPHELITPARSFDRQEECRSTAALDREFAALAMKECLTPAGGRTAHRMPWAGAGQTDSTTRDRLKNISDQMLRLDDPGRQPSRGASGTGSEQLLDVLAHDAFKRDAGRASSTRESGRRLPAGAKVPTAPECRTPRRRRYVRDPHLEDRHHGRCAQVMGGDHRMSRHPRPADRSVTLAGRQPMHALTAKRPRSDVRPGREYARRSGVWRARASPTRPGGRNRRAGRRQVRW